MGMGIEMRMKLGGGQLITCCLNVEPRTRTRQGAGAWVGSVVILVSQQDEI